jgi:hypothetical protein
MELVGENGSSVVAGVSKAQTGKKSVNLLRPAPRKTLKRQPTNRLLDNAQRGTPRYANPPDAVFLRLIQAQFPNASQNMHVLVTVQMGKSPRVNTIIRAEQQLSLNLGGDRYPDCLPSKQ